MAQDIMMWINGIPVVPSPDSLTAGIMDISNAERNAAGTIIIERIATKRKLSLGWQFISDSNLSALLNLVAAVFFTTKYPDPLTGKLRIGTFYCGDRTVEGITYRNGKMYWKNLKFDIIER
jgi:hypothetical protein